MFTLIARNCKLSNRFAWLHPLIVFAGVLVVYWMTLPREVTFEDAGLFQMTCHLGGIAHPPGYPIFTTLCIPFVNLSIWGDPSVMPGNFLSALFGAVGVAVFYQICFKVLADRTLAYVAAFAYGFSATYWSQAIIIEVYSLAAMMFMICWLMLILFVETRNDRYWYLFCFSVGLALSNHWPLMVLSTPALIACAWPAMDELPGRLRLASFWLVSFTCFGFGLAPYVMLVIDQNPEIAMIGAPSSVEAFIDYVSRSIYSDSEEASGGRDSLLFAGWLSKESLFQAGIAGAPVV
ncbi:MAG: DUF2723 domain-containing protein, partial [Pseudomonadales bacterium]|nr:DUF2723 domain-containing protein [Pseudomonadales bacterium]